MLALVLDLLATIRSTLRTRTELALEILALGQQVAGLHRSLPRPRLPPADRAFWICLSQINVTEHPGAAWTAQQIIESFPEDTTPGYIIRDRDDIYGDCFCRHVEGKAVEQVLTTPRSPWRNPYAERLVGSVRRECLDRVIVLGERHLRRILKSYFAYCHHSRTHLSLGEDAPEPRAVHRPHMGEVVELPVVAGLHHRCERRAA